MRRQTKGFSLEAAAKWCNANKVNEPLRFVQMYDRDAIGKLDGDKFTFRSDKIARTHGKLDEVKVALAFRFPYLAGNIVHDITLEGT